LRLLPRLRRLRRLGRFARVLTIPAPDRPVVRAAVLLALQIEAGDGAEDVEPGACVATDFDLGFDRAERVERLIEEIAHHAGLRFVAGGADVADAEVVVDAHVALDKSGDLPIMGWPIVTFEHEDVAAAGGAGVALATPLVIGVRERGADRIAELLSVVRLSGANAVGETSFFHGASRPTA
jgi:hypothetical protein